MLPLRSLRALVRGPSKSSQSIRKNSGKKLPWSAEYEEAINKYPGMTQIDTSDWKKFSFGMPYRDFDYFVPDIDEDKLTSIGACHGIKNLSSASFPSTPFPVTGRIHGLNFRPMVPLVCQRITKSLNNSTEESKPFNVWFLVATGSPYTCLTAKSIEKLIGHETSHELLRIAIQDLSINHECRLSKGHFANANILGTDVLSRLELSIIYDWKAKQFQLVKH